eukprot:TRINITY_DN7394_c0_g1_i1.p1 TRINITY_DN7394_c0_g1~~TRINITY_DN7394_c0_g1_i1.p1  ORF type:complete len:554 (+),score=170.15 TRINITY_DN7394_c0_g1_i1:105-1766(+)
MGDVRRVGSSGEPARRQGSGSHEPTRRHGSAHDERGRPPRTGSGRHVDPAPHPAHRKQQLAQCRDEELFVGEVDPNFICPVGQGVMVSPVVTPCGHEFCQGCLNKALMRKEECPMCRRGVLLTAVPTLKVPQKTARCTKALDVYCDNKPTGCEWTGRWGDLADHLKTCPYEVVKCRNMGCKTWFQRQHTDKHIKDCPHRPVVCEYCKKTVSFATYEAHAESCEERPVACPTGCNTPGLTKGALPGHLDKCDLAMVPCPYAVHGCKASTMQRRHLRAHLESAMVEHNILLCAKVAQQGQVIAGQQAKISKLLKRTVLVVDARGKGPFATISDALDASEPGDRVLVKPGVYKECITVGNGVTLEADGKSGTVVIENGKDNNVVVMKEAAAIQGFTLRQRSRNFFCVRVTSMHEQTVVRNCDIMSEHFSCMQIDTGANPQVHHNTIHSSKQCGILIKANGMGYIHHNVIHNNSLSNVYIDEGASPTLVYNEIHSSQQHGVWVKPGSHADISRNAVFHNRMDAIKIEDGAQPKVSKNDFTAPPPPSSRSAVPTGQQR